MDSASPRFRKDLVASMTEADGVACVDVSDPKTGTSFRLYDFEYQLALQLNGQPLQEVTAWAAKAYGADLTVEGIGEFAGRLSELGFLEPSAAPAAPAPDPATADEPAESAADEWMSAQAVKTAQFDPDPSMLEGPPDPTPVAALSPDEPAEPARATAPALPIAEPEPTAPAAPLPEAPTRPALPAIPMSALGEPGAPSKPAGAADSGGSKWAKDLDGDLQAPDSPPAVRLPVPAPVKDVQLPVLPGSKAAPIGAAERRQPPAPEAVVMSGFSDDVAARKRKAAGRRSRAPWLVVVVVLALAGLAAGGYYLWRSQQRPPAPQAIRVRVFEPTPTAVYRWFSGRGSVTGYATTTLGFSTAGRLTDLLPPGTELLPGDVVGKLAGAAALQSLLDHDRSRVAFYRQVRDSMRAADNQPELRQAEAHLAEKQQLVDEAAASLARVTLTASEPGEVIETLAKVGTQVAANAPIVRLRGRVLHGAFELDPDEAAVLRKLDFCRIEVVGLGPSASNAELARTAAPPTAADSTPPEAQAAPRFVDCKPLPPGSARSAEPARGDAAATPLEVELPSDVGLVSGQPLRLARKRYDAVFPVPRAALVDDGAGKAIWIARAGQAEARPVAVAEPGGDEALVSGGLRVGDQVIVDPSPALYAGAPVAVSSPAP